MGKKEEERFQKWVEESWLPSLKPELHNSAKALINDETARTELMNGYLRQDDYSKKTAELARAKEELDARLGAERAAAIAARDAEYQQWYQGANAEYLKMQTKADTLEKALTAAGYQPGQPKKETTVEQDELLKQLQGLESRLNAVDRGTYNTVVGMSTLAFRAAKDNYSFDPAKIVEIAQARQMPLERAFEEFIAPEKDARQKAAFEKQLEEAREAGRKEVLSNRPTPDAMGMPTSSPVHDRLFKSQEPSAARSQNDIINDAVKGFYEAGQS